MYLYKYDTQSYINQLRSLVLIKTVFREREKEREEGEDEFQIIQKEIFF